MMIMVTGSSGFIGGHLVRYLLDRNHEVTGVDIRKPSSQLLHPNYEFRLVNLADVHAVWSLVGSHGRGVPDAVVHLAGRGGVRDSIHRPEEHIDANVRTTANLLSRKKWMGRFILASSSSVYGSRRGRCKELDGLIPESPYAASKVAAEALCHAASAQRDFLTVALRFFNVYGQNIREDMALFRWARSMVQGKPVELYGDCERDWTWITDVCDAIEKACTTDLSDGAHVFNVASGNTIPIGEMARDLGEFFEGDHEFVDLGRQDGDLKSCRASITAAESILDWRLKTPRSIALREFSKWFLHNISVPDKMAEPI